MKIIPFKAAHLDLMAVQPAQVRELAVLPAGARAWFERASAPGITAVADGRVVGCAGLLPMPGSRAVLWAFLSKHAGVHMVGITRVARGLVAHGQYERVETTVVEGFEPGHRWARLVGLVNETPSGMPKYDEEGKTHYQYARVS